MPKTSLSPTLLTMLACPSEDHAPLREEADSLVCTFCATRYPIDDGIPVLLLDDATPGPNGIGVAAGDGATAAVADVAEVVEVADVLDGEDVSGTDVTATDVTATDAAQPDDRR